MDKYLLCLFNYILEERRDETLLKTMEYQTLHKAIQESWNAVANALSRDQLEIVNEYLSLQGRMSVCETEWMFLEGVALGKWLAR